MRVFEKEDFKDLVEILNKTHKHKFDIRHQTFKNTIWLYNDDDEAELYLRCLVDKITIARIAVNPQRNGTGTMVLEWLKKYAKEHEYKYIIMESTCTEMVNNFCLKHSFKPIKYHGIYKDGQFYGDYELVLY